MRVLCVRRCSKVSYSCTTPGQNYTVPADNPFVSDATYRPEIWATGLRNPWRYSFDPRGRLIVADVGQNAWEEVSLVPPGANMGWNQNRCKPASKSNQIGFQTQSSSTKRFHADFVRNCIRLYSLHESKNHPKHG